MKYPCHFLTVATCWSHPTHWPMQRYEDKVISFAQCWSWKKNPQNLCGIYSNKCNLSSPFTSTTSKKKIQDISISLYKVSDSVQMLMFYCEIYLFWFSFIPFFEIQSDSTEFSSEDLSPVESAVEVTEVMGKIRKFWLYGIGILNDLSKLAIFDIFPNKWCRHVGCLRSLYSQT